MPSQRGLPAAQGRSLRRRGPRGFTSRCSPSRRRFRRLDTASAPRPLTNGHLLGHSQTDAAPPLSRSALRSELRPPGRAAIRVISTSSLHLKRGTALIKGSRPTGSPPRMTMPASPLHRVVRNSSSLNQPACSGLPKSRRQHWQEHDRHESPDHGDARGIAPPASAERGHQRLIHCPPEDYAQASNRSMPRAPATIPVWRLMALPIGCCER